MLERILAILADGAFHSGSDLAAHLGVTRTTVWNRVRELEVLGVPVHRVRGRGYRVPGGFDRLDAAQIHEHMHAPAREAFGIPRVHLRTTSTNDLALAAGRDGAGPYLCFAEYQEAGRGRRGRVWQSPLGANLCFSFLLRFTGGAAAVEGLSLAIGLGIARALVELGVEGVGLKWPNDVLVEGEKIGGILVEISGDLAGEFCVVAGLGLNVAMQRRSMNIDQPWTDLSRHLDAPVSRNLLAACVLNQLAGEVASFRAHGFSARRETWNAFDCMQGRRVVLRAGDRETFGVCAGVDERGGIGLRGPGGVHYYYGGEITLREAAE